MQVSIWISETKSPTFGRECRRQSRLASMADQSVQLHSLFSMTRDRSKAGPDLKRRHRDHRGPRDYGDPRPADSKGGPLQQYSRQHYRRAIDQYNLSYSRFAIALAPSRQIPQSCSQIMIDKVLTLPPQKIGKRVGSSRQYPDD